MRESINVSVDRVFGFASPNVRRINPIWIDDALQNISVIPSARYHPLVQRNWMLKCRAYKVFNQCLQPPYLQIEVLPIYYLCGGV